MNSIYYGDRIHVKIFLSQQTSHQLTQLNFKYSQKLNRLRKRRIVSHNLGIKVKNWTMNLSDYKLSILNKGLNFSDGHQNVNTSILLSSTEPVYLVFIKYIININCVQKFQEFC